MALVRHGLGCGLFPAQLARVAVEAEDFKPIEMGRWLGLRLEARVRFGQLVRLGFPVGLHGREDEDLVIPDDRRGASGARQFGLPLDVAERTLLAGSGRVPLDGRIRGRRGHAIGGRPAPARPVVRALRRGECPGEDKGERQADPFPHEC